jgi:hypothetical protein
MVGPWQGFNTTDHAKDEGKARTDGDLRPRVRSSSGRRLTAQALGQGRQPPTLGIGELQSPATKVLAENSVRLLRRINQILLAAVHPAG